MNGKSLRENGRDSFAGLINAIPREAEKSLRGPSFPLFFFYTQTQRELPM